MSNRSSCSRSARLARSPLLLLLGLCVGCLLSISTLQGDEASTTQEDETPVPAKRAPRPSSKPSTGHAEPAAEAGVSSEPHTDNQSDQSKARKKFETKAAQIERASASRQGQPYQAPTFEGRLSIAFDALELGHIYDNTPNGTRFLAGRLKFLNLTADPVTIPTGEVKLHLPDQVLAQAKPEQITNNASFNVDDTYHSLTDIKRPDTVTVKPGELGEAWVLYYGVDFGTTMPPATIEVAIGNEKRILNLKDQLLGQLGFEVKRIGPSGALGLFTISGQLNLATLNLLAEEIDKLVAANVSRLVIHWAKDAPQVVSNVDYFLFSYATASGRNSNQHHDQRFPVLSSALREIHLSNMPGSNYSSNDSKQVAHKELPDAVAAALWTALERMPADLLLDQIERGDPLVRPAALAAGSSRLSPAQLPMVLKYLRDDTQADMRKAAIYALRNFGTPEAVDALIQIVHAGDEKLRPLALASLTASRYELARSAIDEMIATSTGDARIALLKELAKAPLPIWSDLFYENAVDTNSPIRADALRALGRLGHDQMVPLLRKTLEDENNEIRDTAFDLIVSRRDPELEPLIEEIVLRRLKTWPIDSSVQNYLNQTRNSKAVPLLLDLLKASKEDQGRRQQLIRHLVEIGDDSVAEYLFKMYDNLTGYERSQVLGALQQMQSPRFMEVARKAIKSKDSSEIHAAINHLQMVDDREAETLLITMYESNREPNYQSNLAHALAQLGSADAEVALRKARKSEDLQRRQAAGQALRNLLQRRPGYNYVYQAQYQMRQNRNKEALDMIGAAIEIDETLSAAHSMKGTIHLRLDQPKEARAAFEQALKLDEDNSEARAGIVRIEMRDKTPETALAAIADLDKQYRGEGEFELQTALAYADARKIVAGREVSDEQKALLEEYTQESLYHLSQTIRSGGIDRQYIESFPELEPLKKREDFANALNGGIDERKAAGDAPPPKETSGTERQTIIRTSGVVILPAPPLLLDE